MPLGEVFDKRTLPNIFIENTFPLNALRILIFECTSRIFDAFRKTLVRKKCLKEKSDV